MGLKRVAEDSLGVAGKLPQSNQRGIETAIPVYDLLDNSMPQSNQRGIETVRARTPAGALARGLNRTSVGLKLHLDLPRGDCLLWASIEPAWD